MDFGKARLPRILISTLDRLPKLTGVLYAMRRKEENVACQKVILEFRRHNNLRNIISGEFVENNGGVRGTFGQHASKCNSIIDSIAPEWYANALCQTKLVAKVTKL